METEKDKPSNSSEDPRKVLKRICNLTASNDDLFALLVPVSFVSLVVLAFLGRAAEMAVVAGFAAVCMAFLRLEKFSEFSGIGFRAKLHDVARTVEAMKIKETELDPEEVSDSHFGQITVTQVSTKERDALQAIESSSYTFRTATGLSQNLGVSVLAARKIMAGLEKKGLVARSVTSRRSAVWNITAQGRNYLASRAK